MDAYQPYQNGPLEMPLAFLIRLDREDWEGSFSKHAD